TCSTPSFSFSVMPCGIRAETLPFGPSTTTVFVWTVYLTPLGSVMGFLPIRDILKSFVACESLVAVTTRSTAAVRVRHPQNNAKTLRSFFTRLRRESRRQRLHGAPDGQS